MSPRSFASNPASARDTSEAASVKNPIGTANPVSNTAGTFANGPASVDAMKVIGQRRKHPELQDGGNDNDFPEIESGPKGRDQQAGSEGRGKARKTRGNPCCRGAHFQSELNHARGVRYVAGHVGQMVERER